MQGMHDHTWALCEMPQRALWDRNSGSSVFLRALLAAPA